MKATSGRASSRPMLIASEISATSPWPRCRTNGCRRGFRAHPWRVDGRTVPTRPRGGRGGRVRRAREHGPRAQTRSNTGCGSPVRAQRPPSGRTELAPARSASARVRPTSSAPPSHMTMRSTPSRTPIRQCAMRTRSSSRSSRSAAPHRGLRHSVNMPSFSARRATPMGSESPKHGRLSCSATGPRSPPVRPP